jgi:imidazole glycerol phosphate synthase subunit HisF
VRRYLDIGADTVSICTLALRKPDEVTKLVRNQVAWFDVIG